jgi:hypothetical protein
MGDSNHSIMVACNNRQYCIGIVKAKPTSAVSIIETDCEVDFAPPPLDYTHSSCKRGTCRLAEDQAANVEDEPKFKPFTGSGKWLDGKGSKQQVPEVSSAAVCLHVLHLQTRTKGQISKLLHLQELALPHARKHESLFFVQVQATRNKHKHNKRRLLK